MKNLLAGITLMCALFNALPAYAADAGYAGKRESTPADVAAIKQVTEDFQAAIATRNAKMLSSLFYSTHVLFGSPANQATIDRVRANLDAHFDGIQNGGYESFLSFVANSKEPLQEKFHNIAITQDGNLGWVLFDYEFLSNGKVQNYGVESWQLEKIDGSWKIISVIWSTHLVE